MSMGYLTSGNEIVDAMGSINISGNIILALNCIIGGLIGGVVLIFKIIGIAGELISIVTGHFWTKSPKVEI